MSIIARPRPQVKTARPFGMGILASRPTHRLDCTVADLAEMAQVFGELSDARESMTDADFDRMADESAMLDRYTRGYCV